MWNSAASRCIWNLQSIFEKIPMEISWLKGFKTLKHCFNYYDRSLTFAGSQTPLIIWWAFPQEKGTNAQKHPYTNISYVPWPRNHLWSRLGSLWYCSDKKFGIIFKCKYARCTTHLQMPVVSSLNTILPQVFNFIYKSWIYVLIISLHRQNIEKLVI